MARHCSLELARESRFRQSVLSSKVRKATFFNMLRRERGTLRETIPESTSVIICFFLVICIGTGTFIAEFSRTSDDTTTTWKDQLLVALKVGLGAVSSTMGIIFVDPLLYSRYFGLTVSVSLLKQI